jgi:hypothetical protein
VGLGPQRCTLMSLVANLCHENLASYIKYKIEMGKCGESGIMMVDPSIHPQHINVLKHLVCK